MCRRSIGFCGSGAWNDELVLKEGGGAIAVHLRLVCWQSCCYIKLCSSEAGIRQFFSKDSLSLLKAQSDSGWREVGW